MAIAKATIGGIMTASTIGPMGTTKCMSTVNVETPSAIKQPFKLFGADKPEIVLKSFMGSAPTKGHPVEMDA